MPSKGQITDIPLAEISGTVLSKASKAGILSPIMQMLKEMSLEWGEVPTTMALKRGGKAVIILGRSFFSANVRNKSEAADLVLHEILHHLFLHLARGHYFTALGYSVHLQALAMDAIINAYLSRFDCAGFMERFYRDVEEQAFLRPNSTEFGVQRHWLFIRHVRPLKMVDGRKYQEFKQFYARLYQLQVGLEEALIFFAKHFPSADDSKALLGSHNQSSKSSSNKGGQTSDQSKSSADNKNSAQPSAQANPAKDKNDENEQEGGADESKDNESGSAGDKSQEKNQERNKEQSKANGRESDDAREKGKHDQKGQAQDAGGEAAESDQSGSGDSPCQLPALAKEKDEGCGAGDAQEHPLINQLQIAVAFKELTAQAVSRQTRNNFAKVIQKILESSGRPGLNRDEYRLSRRIPAKLKRRDMLNAERGRDLFTHNQHVQKAVWLLPDVSGSMTSYLPFVVGLIQSLKRHDIDVRIACWSERVSVVPVEEMLKSRLPKDLGVGTDGQVIANFINEQSIKEAVIITDNEAGDISTKIKGFVHLCLIEGSAQTGSFLNTEAVPRVQTYELKLKDPG